MAEKQHGLSLASLRGGKSSSDDDEDLDGKTECAWCGDLVDEDQADDEDVCQDCRDSAEERRQQISDGEFWRR